MKRILSPIVLLTLLFPSLAYGVTMDDLVKRDGIHYKKFSDVPFTGKVTGKSQGSLKNGKREGPWVRYWENGQLGSKATYKDGKRDGPWVAYHDNGQLWEKGTYKNGKQHGPWVAYHYYGQVGYKGTFGNGKQHGPWVYFNKDGTVWKSLTGTYKNGVKVN